MLLYFSFYRQSKNHNQKSCHTGSSHHVSSDCSTTASIAEYSLCSKGRKTGIELLYGQMRSNLNSFVLGCKYFWSKSAIFKNRSGEFCSFFENPQPSQKWPTGWLLCSLPTCSLYVHSHFIPSFIFLQRAIPRPRRAPSVIWHARSVGSHLAALR